MSAELLSGLGAARRAVLAGAVGAAGPRGTGSGSLSSSALTPFYAAYVLGRLGFGHAPHSSFYNIAHFQSLGATDDERLTAFVDEQLNPTLDGQGNVVDPDVDARLANPAYVTLGKSFDQLWTDYEVNGNPSGGPYARDYPIREGERAVFVRAIYGRWQLVEQLADFWHNHFNVYGYDRYAAPTWTSWDRDVIRKNMLGNFRTMLQKTFESPAMLYFLDNYINRAPSFNENYAREVCELHTLGAINYLGPELQQSEVPLIPAGEDGAGWPVGYVDADVYEMARALTGWTFGNGQNGTTYDGHPAFVTAWHDIGQKTVLGAFVPANTQPATEIATFLDRIAKHPGTGRHIALKLAQRFIGDDPPQDIVDNAAHVFYQNVDAPDQLKQTLRAILLYDAGPGSFRDVANFGNKIKRPFETVVSGLRGAHLDYTFRRNIDDESPSSDRFMDRFRRTGERPFDWRAPNGFPDDSSDWMGSTALVHAWRTIDWAIDENTGTGQTPLAPVLARTLSEFSADPNQHTPNKLANFWIGHIFGWSPDATNGWIGTDLHTKVRDFMCRNTDTLNMWPPDAGIGTGSAGNTQGIETNSSPNYWYNRLRGMIDVILFSPQFMVR
jgi:uncharacterized protein (DUF1800 family)